MTILIARLGHLVNEMCCFHDPETTANSANTYAKENVYCRKILVPDDLSKVAILGSSEEMLHLLEKKLDCYFHG